MNTRVALLGSFTLSWLLTGCPLVDHYQLAAEDAGSTSAGADQAGAHSSGGRLSRAGAGGASAGAGADTPTAAGEAGESTVSGGPNGGAVDVAGAPAGGADTGGGGALQAGGGDVGGGATAGFSGAGTAGNPSSAGSAGTAGGTGCALLCTSQETCCGTSCADLSNDPLNCNVCGNACNVGRPCAESACKGGWVLMAAPPTAFVARSRAAVVAIDKQVFFWGGQDGNGAVLDTGAIYNPVKNAWKFLPKDAGAPTARMMASAVFTGTSVIVFGGTDANGNVYRDGAVYDIPGSQWTALPMNNAVSRRSAPYSYWDGTRAFFYGGLNSSSNAVGNADRYDLTSWSTSTSTGDPGAILYPGVAFDGATMYLFGGLLNNNTRQDKVYSYTPSSDTWLKLTSSGLTARSGAFVIWDGTRLVSWGGRDDNGLRSDGSYLLGSKWTALASFGAPGARLLNLRRAGWGFQVSPGVVAIIGGQTSLTSSTPLSTSGAYYDVASSTWTAIGNWPSGAAHEYGMGAWTGDEFVLWGGRDSNGVISSGERWAL